MKVGDLARPRRGLPAAYSSPSKVFLVVRARQHVDTCLGEVIWLYPDPDGNPGYDHNDDDNYHFKHFFEVVSESR